MRVWYGLALVVALGVGLAVGALALGQNDPGFEGGYSLQTPYKAVLLDDNQVYYGMLHNVNDHTIMLEDVYYIQHVMDPKTKQVRNVLIPRGREWHGPGNRMLVNKRHIVLVESVGETSEVARLIADSHTAPPQPLTPAASAPATEPSASPAAHNHH